MTRNFQNRNKKKSVLVIMQDEKSNHYYIRKLLQSFRYNKISFKCKTAKGLEGKSLFDFGKKIYNQNRAYTHIFFIFDEEGHDRNKKTSFNKMLQLVRTTKLRKNILNEQVIIKTFTSNFCFEIWYVMHFVGKSNIGNYANADEIVKHVISLLLLNDKPDEFKKRTDLYEIITENNDLEIAIQNAKLLNKDNNYVFNTQVCDMIEYLNELNNEE